MKTTWQPRRSSWMIGLLAGLLSRAAAQVPPKPALPDAGGLPESTKAQPAARMVTADTTVFSVGYATLLPPLTAAGWEKAYVRFARLMPPAVRRTQQGLAFQGPDGIRVWQCLPAAQPHAQLDTATRIADPRRLQGEWRGVANRVIVHRDSFSTADQRYYRTVRAKDMPTALSASLTDKQFRIQGISLDGDARQQAVQRKYELVAQRYLLLYGLLKSGAGVLQAGIDAQGRLLLHFCAVQERGLRGRYQVYETTIRQMIFELASP